MAFRTFGELIWCFSVFHCWFRFIGLRLTLHAKNLPIGGDLSACTEWIARQRATLWMLPNMRQRRRSKCVLGRSEPKVAITDDAKPCDYASAADTPTTIAQLEAHTCCLTCRLPNALAGLSYRSNHRRSQHLGSRRTPNFQKGPTVDIGNAITIHMSTSVKLCDTQQHGRILLQR